MQKRSLGDGLDVSALGLGCMTMTWAAYGEIDLAESERALDRALDLGVTLIDTADMYGAGNNEEFVGRVVGRRRDDVVLATKFGITPSPSGTSADSVIDSRPEYAVQACDASLRRLGLDHIDLYYLHRRNPDVPIEDTVGAMAGLVQAGKVRHIGLSEVNADTLRRAHAVHPIAALQTEYSLWERSVEAEILPACRELGIGFVPYSPVGRGFLSGNFTSSETLDENDFRRNDPRFSVENATTNMAIVERVRELASVAGVTPVQLALAWLLAQGPDIVPIPGTKRVRYVEENVAAAAIGLTAEQVGLLDAAAPVGAASGARYAPGGMEKVGQ